MQWETVIGLEVHVQLATQTKLFSGASTAFGNAANTQACAIDIALPGTLPVPNKQAFRYAIMFGLAIDAEINHASFFERKNYFYPDLPKGYQTTQLEKPIVGAGHIDIALANGQNKRVRIHHAHLEEDAGKSLHEDYHGMSGIDLNRAGTPLIEIVSEPDMRTAEEAVAFAKKLHSLVTSLGICDGEMSQGSMRFDVNISIRPKGSDVLGTRTETKNLNSFRFMESAIELEVDRQICILEDGGTIAQETRLYDGDKHIARSMRSKEEANDYRYFPCPDLLPVIFTAEEINAIKATLPELPEVRKARFLKDYQLSEYDAESLAGDKATADYFEKTAKQSNDAKLSVNWIMGELSARLNEGNTSIKNCPISPEHLGLLIQRITDNTISSKIAKTVFDFMWQENKSPDEIIKEKSLKQETDSGAIEQLVDSVINDNPEQVEQYRASDEDKQKKLIGFFVGQIMKVSQGKANPQQVNTILKQKLNG